MKTAVFSANTSWYLYNFRRNTLAALLERGWKVFVVSPKDDSVGNLLSLGCSHVDLHMRPSSLNPFRELRVIVEYILAYRRIRPDAAFHFTIKCNLYGSIAARLLGVPYVNNISGLGSAFNGRGPLNWLVRKLYRITQGGARRIFVQNEPDFEYLIGQGLIDRSKAEVISGSGVDLERFRPDLPAPSGRFTFVFAGRLLWEKGLGYLAEAMRELRKAGAPAECLVYGFTSAGDDKYVPEDRLRAWESEGLLRFGGSLDDVRVAYWKADCVVLPTFYREGIPRGLLEAAAMAKPLIATDWIGCREVVREGLNGYLCPIKDAGALAGAMLRIMNLDPGLRKRMGDESRNVAESRFDEKNVIDRYLDALSSFGEGSVSRRDG